MKNLTKFGLAATAILALSAPVWAMGTLTISSVSKINTATGDNLIVTATCVKDRGNVKIWVSETTTLVQTKIYTARKDCGKTAANSGTTVSVPVNNLAPGTYYVILRQDGVQSAPSEQITLP